jgi:UDP-glucose 4-epimerase
VKLLVTGGAGYIGSVVAARLMQEGHEAVVLDDFSTGHESGVPAGLRVEQVDLLDAGRVAELLREGFDGVLHFAAKALVEESVRRPELYWRTNVMGTRNLLDAMRDAGVRRLVFSSTCAVYGQPDDVPISEEAPTRPANAYGASKLAVDLMIAGEARAHGLGAMSLRYFNVAGASGDLGEDHQPETHLVPLVLQVAMGKREHVSLYGTDYPTPDGTAIRDYVHVEDLAEAHDLALGALEQGTHEILNLGNGSGFSVRDVVEAARAVTGHEIPTVDSPRRPGDPAVLIASNERIRSRLGWEPRKPRMESMIGDAWTWHQAHPHGHGQARPC